MRAPDIVDDAPSGLVDFDRAPFGVGEIEIDLVVKPADANEHLPDRRVILSFGVDDADRGGDRLAGRRAVLLLEIAPPQPAPEPTSFDSPCFGMAVDLDVGVADLVWGVKKLGRLGQHHQNVSLGRRTPVKSLAASFGD